MKLHKTFFYFFFFLVFTTSAQITQDSIYLKELRTLGKSLSLKADTRSQLVLINKMLVLSEKQKDTARIIGFLHTIGRQSQFIQEHFTAIKSFQKELELYNKYNFREKEKDELNSRKITQIEILVQLGNSYAAIGETKIGLDYFSKSETIAKKENLQFYNAVIPVLIGGMHFNANEYKKALSEYKKGYNRLQKAKDIDELNIRFNSSLTLISISGTHLKLKRIDSAKIVLKQLKNKGLDTINDLIKLNYLTQKNRILIAEKKYTEALSELKVIKELSYKYDSNSGEYYYYKELAQAYEGLGKYDSAAVVMQKGITIGLTKTKEFNLVEDYKTLAKIYKKAGNLEKSNEYFEKYVLNQTSLEKNRKKIIETFHNKEVSGLEIEKQKQKRNISFLVIGGSILIALLLLYLFSLSKKRKDNAEKFDTLLQKIESLEQQQLIDTKDKVLEEKSNSDINKDTFDEILAGLQKIEEQHYYLKQECNSYNVAKKIKTNTSYLSKVINAHYQKNFNTYINDLRINYVILKLKEDSRFRSYSIQSISEDIGYKSTDSFTKYFKRRTGLLPSVYIKKLNSIS